MASFIANTLEDGYVEARMLNQFTGVLGSSLEQMRRNQFDDMPTVDQMIEQEDDGSSHIFLSVLQIMLSYAKFGQIKYGSTPLSDERIQVIFRMIPMLDHAVTTTSAKERWKVVSYIMIHCWEYLHDYLELCKQKQDDSASSGDCATAGDILQALLKGLKGSSEAGEGDGTPIAGLESGSISNQSAARAATRALAAASEEGEANEKESGGSGKEENETAAEAAKSDSGDTDQESFSENQSGKVGKQQVSDTPGGNIPHTHTDQVSEPVGGEFEYDPDYQREQYENAASDIDRMLDQMAERAANRQLENERLQELNETAQSISYGNIHSGVRVTVHRIDQVDEELETQYNTICDPLLTISRQLQRNLIQKLKDQQRGGKQTGLVMGRRLDAHALCRNDGKVFYKNQLQYQEMLYRIDVLETCMAFVKTAPVTMDQRVLSTHYQMLDAFLMCMLQERKIGQPGDETVRKQRETAYANFQTVVNTFRKQFSSFRPANQDTYRNTIQNMVGTILPAWMSYRNTYVSL